MEEQIINDRFEILGELGRGGQGTVYLARDRQLDRKVAIKTLRKHGQQTEQLLREAMIVSKLLHPNIVPLYDVGEHDDKPYLVYAYIEGRTLAQILKEDKTLPFARAAAIVRDVLKGLAYAHAQGVSHLDIKPGNIMIAKNGTAMVMDFGLATTNSFNEQATTNLLNGTPRYVAPEVISGQPGGPLADVYATGAVLYEAVTGSYAVTGENFYEVLNRAAHEQVAPPSTLNADMDETLETIILSALAKNPDERYPNAASMQRDIEDYLDSSRNATIEFLMQRMRSKQDFPAISGVISEINRIVSSEETSNSELASVILQDLALTNKLMRLVNTAAFNRFGGSINTVSKAISILGFETVRNIATSLILFEFMQNRSQAAQLKEEIIRAVLAGELAAGITSRQDIRNVEEVLIGALFHNLGKMLAIFYFFEESQEIARLVAAGENEESAAARILGIPYPELGMHVARKWNYPSGLIAAMRTVSADEVPQPRNEQEQMTVTINLAYDLCQMSATSAASDKARLLAELSSRYRAAIVATPQELDEALKTGLGGMGKRSAVMNVNTAGSALLSRARLWSGQELPGQKSKAGDEMDGITDLGKSVAEKFGGGETLTLSLNPDSILGAGIQDVTNTMMGDYKLNDVLQIVLETMHRGMGFHRTLLMIRNNQQGIMAARFGFGPGIAELIPHFHFPLRYESNVFNLCVEKGLDISIEDVRSLNIRDKIPAWYRDTANAASFILLPLVMDGKTIGMIYGDMLDAHQLDISHQQLSLMRTLRNQAVLAIRQKV